MIDHRLPRTTGRLLRRATPLLLTMVAVALRAPGAQEELYLTLEDSIQMALERNYSIRIERFGPKVADQDLRAARGLFDPVLTAEYGYSNSEYRFLGAEDEVATASVGMEGMLPWGTTYDLELRSNDRTTPFAATEPSIVSGIDSFAGITVTQPVLRGFGLGSAAYAEVSLARNNSAASREFFRATLIDTLTETINAYTDLGVARQAYAIAIRNRDLAARLLEDNRKRVETGAMAPVDIIQAESEVALREVNVISAELLMQTAENRLKGLIFDDPRKLANTSLSIEPAAAPARMDPDPRTDYIRALAFRPDYRSAELQLANREVEVRRDRSSSLPQLDLVASYGRRGLDDHDLGDAWDDLRDDGDRSWSVGAVFSLPIPNRTRDARKVSSYLRRNQTQLQLEKLEQDILVEVLDAANRLRADWRRVEAAREARQLAEKSLRAEEKKLQAGTTTTFVVLRLQGDLATAEIRELQSVSDYRTSLTEYQRALGTTLDNYNVTVE